jgi:hypothetical protein
MDAALYGFRPRGRRRCSLLSHRNTKRYSTQCSRGRGGRHRDVVVGGRGSPGVDVETVEQERSRRFTASHLGALLRVAQISARSAATS